MSMSRSVVDTGWQPVWAALGVGAWMSTRGGGSSRPPYDSLNLGTEVGDEPLAVQANRQRFEAALGGAVPVFLKQVHGTRVVHLQAEHLRLATPLEADAAVCTEPGLACTVQVADCLPVLFAAPRGGAVGAAHAGWRGLAAGVLEATVARVCALAGCGPGEVHAWLGPCIGPRCFEVGDEVRAAFHAAPPACFTPGALPGKHLADLCALARWRLQEAGLRPGQIEGGGWCTVEDPSRFFSFRRDRVTGRLAAAIWRLG